MISETVRKSCKFCYIEKTRKKCCCEDFNRCSALVPQQSEPGEMFKECIGLSTIVANLFPITGISWDKAWLLYLCFEIPFSFLYCSAARYSKRNGLQVMQRGFCCRTCLVWVRAVVKSYLTTFYVTNKSFFFCLIESF